MRGLIRVAAIVLLGEGVVPSQCPANLIDPPTVIDRWYFEEDSWPGPITIDAHGQVYTVFGTDAGWHLVKLLEDGSSVPLWDLPNGASDLAVDSDGNVYTLVNKDIERYSAGGTLLQSWHTGSDSDWPQMALFENLFVYVLGHRELRKFTTSGELLAVWPFRAEKPWLVPPLALDVAVDSGGRFFVVLLEAKSRPTYHNPHAAEEMIYLKELDEAGQLVSERVIGQWWKTMRFVVDSGVVYGLEGGSSWPHLEVLTTDGVPLTSADFYGLESWDSPGSLVVDRQGRILITSRAWSPGYWSQHAVVGVVSPLHGAAVVAANKDGGLVRIDGIGYSKPTVFDWDPGSVHLVSVEPQQHPRVGVRLDFAGWSDGTSGSVYQFVAGDHLRSLTALFDTSYWLDVKASGTGSVTPASAWQRAGAEVEISASPGPRNDLVRWELSGEAADTTGGYSGSEPTATVTMRGPMTESALFLPSGYEFSISASDTDPFVNVGTPTGGPRKLYLWVTCAERGVTAFEADVSGTLEPLGFVLMNGVLNVYADPRKLLLAVPNCPIGSSAEFLLGYWVVIDDGGEFCLAPAAGSGVLGVADCYDFKERDAQVRGFSSAGSVPCVTGANGCRAVAAASAVPISALSVEKCPEGLAVSWSLSPSARGGSCDVRRAARPSGPFSTVASMTLARSGPHRCVDGNVDPGRTYWYQVIVRDDIQGERPFGPISATAAGTLAATELREPRPNPFRGETALQFTLAEPQAVGAGVYDVIGRLVRRIGSVPFDIGTHSLLWDGRDDLGASVPAGMYLVRLKGETFSGTRKVVHLGR
ncbi:MAG: FlgD immunoglobulin-like domain containing protein [Candidatus Eiseniibacteriota bacterium]